MFKINKYGAQLLMIPAICFALAMIVGFLKGDVDDMLIFYIIFYAFSFLIYVVSLIYDLESKKQIAIYILLSLIMSYVGPVFIFLLIDTILHIFFKTSFRL